MARRVKSIFDVPVYPLFAGIRRKENLVDNPHICEDDQGRLSFLSSWDKEEFIKEHTRGASHGIH